MEKISGSGVGEGHVPLGRYLGDTQGPGFCGRETVSGSILAPCF